MLRDTLVMTSPVRADYLLRLKGGYLKHCYHRPLKEALLVPFFFFSFFLLFLYISLHCFLRDISHGCYIIASCPKCSVPLTTLIWMYIILLSTFTSFIRFQKNHPLQMAFSQHYTPGTMSPALNQSLVRQRNQMTMNT